MHVAIVMRQHDCAASFIILLHVMEAADGYEPVNKVEIVSNCSTVFS